VSRSPGWPRRRALSALNYLRRNHAQHELAERYDASQPTISRTLACYTPILGEVLGEWVVTADDLDPDEQLLIDGTLLPCWSWAEHPELYSGKHRTTGMNLQIAATLAGRFVWASDPMPGSTHDAAALRAAGLLDIDNGPAHIGDKG